VEMKRLLLLLPFVLLFSGCFSRPIEPTTYYLMEYVKDAATAVPSDGSAIAGTAVVAPSQVFPAYDRRQIVRRLDGPQIRYMTRDLWAVSVSDGVTDMLYTRTRDSGVFTSVSRDLRTQPAPYRVSAHIDRLEYVCCDTPPRAVVEGELVWISSENTEVLVRHRIALDVPLSAASPRLFVETVNEGLSREIDHFLQEVADRGARG